MMTRRHKMSRRRRYTRKHFGGKKNGKKWTSAIESAQKTLSKTGSLEKARLSLRKQALSNARKLFGAIST